MITVVATLKGGTGKSTVSFNLSVWLASHGFKVQVIDLDPQQTLVDVITIRSEEGYEPQLSVGTGINKVKKKKDHQTIVDVGTADIEALKEAVKRADRVIIPVPPSQADVWSTQRFLGIVEGVVNSKKSPELLAFVNKADTNPAIRETNETQEALRQLPGMKIVMARLGNRTVFRRSFSEGLAVFELEPRSKAATEMNALATVLFSSLFIQG
jgi:chromosome partitioning protein